MDNRNKDKQKGVFAPKPFYDAITGFIFVSDEPVRADVIFVPGGTSGEHAVTAAGLYFEGMAPLIVPSGKYSKVAGHYIGPLQDRFETEADYLTWRLMEQGVPAEAIMPEREATFTWENALFSKRRLDEAGIGVHTAILCCKAYHARRCLLYYQSVFTDTTFCVVPTVTEGIDAQSWMKDREKTRAVLGEVRRIGEQFGCMLPLGDPLGY